MKTNRPWWLRDHRSHPPWIIWRRFACIIDQGTCSLVEPFYACLRNLPPQQHVGDFTQELEDRLHSVTFSSSFTLKPLNFLLKPWLIFAYSWFIIPLLSYLSCFTLTHHCWLIALSSHFFLTHLVSHWLITADSLLHHPTSFLLILFHIDSSPLTHCSTLYYINLKYLPCIP